MDITLDWLETKGRANADCGFDYKSKEAETEIYVEILGKLVGAGAEINDA